jgi:hypothetical protein
MLSLVTTREVPCQDTWGPLSWHVRTIVTTREVPCHDMCGPLSRHVRWWQSCPAAWTPQFNFFRTDCDILSPKRNKESFQFQNSLPIDMTIHWKALEEQFLMVKFYDQEIFLKNFLFFLWCHQSLKWYETCVLWQCMTFSVHVLRCLLIVSGV